MARRAIKKCIMTEGYLERWNDTDGRIRGDLTKYIASVRVPSWFEKRILNKLKGSNDAVFLMFDPNEEGGMPHTHGHYILLPNTNISEKTLAHEKMHIFQRFNTCQVIAGIKEPITGFEYPENNHRANPDTNRILFGDIRPTWSSTATKMNHIDDPRDHPFELLAYGHGT